LDLRWSRVKRGVGVGNKFNFFRAEKQTKVV
jgi:hypothetical protein